MRIKPMSPAGKRLLLVTAVLGLLVFTAHFSRIRQYGFYEDDYLLIAPHLDVSVSARAVFRCVAFGFSAQGQGRPLAYLLTYLAAATVGKAWGMTALYISGFAFVWRCSVP